MSKDAPAVPVKNLRDPRLQITLSSQYSGNEGHFRFDFPGKDSANDFYQAINDWALSNHIDVSIAQKQAEVLVRITWQKAPEDWVNIAHVFEAATDAVNRKR